MINIDSRLLRELDGDEIKLLAVLADYMNTERVCWPSVTKVAKDCGWSPDKVNRIKKRLLEKKLLTAEPRFRENAAGQTSNLYKIITTQVQKYNPPANLLGGDMHPCGPRDSSTAVPSGGKSAVPPPAPVSDEVLGIEALNNEVLNNEVSEKEKEKSLSRYYALVFQCLIETIYQDYSDYCIYGFDISLLDKKVNDITVRSFVKKIYEAAQKIYSAFNALKRPLPEYRVSGWGSEPGDINPLNESTDQIKAYVDFCNLTGTHLATKSESIPETIIRVDWCKKLLDWVDDQVKKEKYDPALDTDGIFSRWILHRYYQEAMGVYICRRYTNRIVYGGEEYLKSR